MLIFVGSSGKRIKNQIKRKKILKKVFFLHLRHIVTLIAPLCFRMRGIPFTWTTVHEAVSIEAKELVLLIQFTVQGTYGKIKKKTRHSTPM